MFKNRMHWLQDGEGTPPVAGDPPAPLAGADMEARLELLTKGIGMIAGTLDTLTQNQSKFESAIAGLKPAEPPAPPQLHQLDPSKLFEGVDLAGMDNAQLATLMTEKLREVAGSLVTAEVTKVRSESDSRINELTTRINDREAAEAVTALKDKNEDFFEWTAEMRAQLAKNPTLSISQSYVLAKAENPAKAVEVAKKYAKPPTSRTFFGLTPTSSGRTEGGGKMTAKDAALDAFDKIFGANGEALSGETKAF